MSATLFTYIKKTLFTKPVAPIAKTEKLKFRQSGVSKAWQRAKLDLVFGGAGNYPKHFEWEKGVGIYDFHANYINLETWAAVLKIKKAWIKMLVHTQRCLINIEPALYSFTNFKNWIEANTPSLLLEQNYVLIPLKKGDRLTYSRESMLLIPKPLHKILYRMDSKWLGPKKSLRDTLEDFVQFYDSAKVGPLKDFLFNVIQKLSIDMHYQISPTSYYQDASWRTLIKSRHFCRAVDIKRGAYLLKPADEVFENYVKDFLEL